MWNLRRSNNGFMVVDLQSDVDGLEFDGLHMRDFQRPFAFSPGFFGGSGALKNLRIADVRIENSWRGVQNFFGAIETFDLVDNIIDVLNFGFAMIGDGSKRGTVKGVKGNEITAGTVGVGLFGAEDAMVRDNQITGGSVGVWLRNRFSPDTVRVGSVIHNTVSDALVGIALGGQSSVRASSASGNVMVDTWVGLLIEEGANGFLAANNEFSGSGLVDIWLGGDAGGFTLPPTTHDNTVVTTDFETSYMDDGLDNKLVGTAAIIENPGVPAEVQLMLEDLRAELAE